MRTVLDPIHAALLKNGLAIISVNYRALAIIARGDQEKAATAITSLGFSYHHGTYYRKGEEIISVSPCADGILVQYNKS